MEAKDGSEGFDFEATYPRVVPRSVLILEEANIRRM